ncbi:zinc finger protein basonuclin-2 [Oreochromis niloticus]|uniref:zinc finger protein basonuclin-2 n=1 Tax=Oreochromis niloticus TaxID=8128 RepID=UPI0003946D87|nr:zinc finger protein basonuclin-2 [Oreochromis niloticus]
MTPDPEESIGCTLSCCSCVCFRPGSVQLRSCDCCGHGWVAHALEKLQAQPQSSCSPVEVALPGVVFDLSCLVLYGAQAIPVRLKVLLDRLYSILSPEQVGHILHTLGWNLGDYVRGYMLQFPNGKVLDRWFMVTPEEELLIFKQFLRFGETRPIVELMLQTADGAEILSDPDLTPTHRSCQSSMNEGTVMMLRSSRGDPQRVTSVCHFEKSSPADHNNNVRHFEKFAGGLSFLLPFHFPSSAFHCLVPPTKELVPPSKLTQFLRKSHDSKLVEKHKQEGGRRGEETDPILHQCKGELAVKVKADPDKPSPPRSLWYPSFHSHQDYDLQRATAKHKSAFSLSPTLNSSTIISSSSIYSPISPASSSPLKISQKVPGSHSSSLHPLPSFSSSFLCPLPTASLSSSLHPPPSSSTTLHPLPSTLCSVPSSAAGGRKGRVCCGVCGKSFYDKGTLKIHYNAVHLKIKHRCTVAGCTMVFSSLRSRNRHSANPNPRLHTSGSRDTYRSLHSDHTSDTQILGSKQPRKNTQDSHIYVYREKENATMFWKHTNDSQAHAHTVGSGLNGHKSLQHCYLQSMPHHADSTPSSSPPQSQNQHTNATFTLNNPQVLPPLPSHLHSVHTASSLGSPPSLIPAVSSTADKLKCPLLTNNDPPSCDTQAASHYCEGNQWQLESVSCVPKKKPRKSSMPVKIEREMVEWRRNENEEEY